MKLRNLSALLGAAVLALSACQGTAPAASPGARPITIGVELPLSGGEAPNGQPTLKGVRLAIDEANARGGIAGRQIQLNVQDDAVAGKNNPEQGAKNMTNLAADPNVVAVVGPFNSAVAKVQIPISNAAGLLQCSPANTAEGLTKPEFGANDLRAAGRGVNYIRVATTDDIQGPAGATHAFTTLGKKSALVIDDQTTYGKGIADNFVKEFERLGGTIVQRVGADKSTTDFVPILTAGKTKNPDVVYYGGVTSSGGGLLRKQMPQAGMGDLPLVGGDGIVDGPGTAQGSYINIAGAQVAANSYGTVAAIGDFPAKKDFDARFTAHFQNDAEFKTPGAYSGPAYACTQVILKALEESLRTQPTADPLQLREAVRAYATTTTNKFDTVLGQISFDQNGDSTQKIISFYTVDPAAANGSGDWKFERQQDFAGTSGGPAATGGGAPAGSPGTSP